MLYLPQEEGHGTTEYAVILVVVAMVVVAILLLLGPQIGDALNLVASEVQKILS